MNNTFNPSKRETRYIYRQNGLIDYQLAIYFFRANEFWAKTATIHTRIPFHHIPTMITLNPIGSKKSLVHVEVEKGT